MKEKFFAIKSGFKTGIFQDTWDNVKQYVSNYPGATYKSFRSQSDADDYMANTGDNDSDNVNETDKDKIVTNKEIEEQVNFLTVDEAIAFVDGSYKSNLEAKHPEKYGYGVIILTKSTDGTVLENTLFNSAFDSEGLKLKNVAGEVMATKEAILWATKMKFTRLHIYYDYAGIKKWALGDWEAKNKITQEYVRFINSQDIELSFTKVNSHTGITYNDKVDALAKKSLEGAAYRTNKDGSIYMKGLSSEKWTTIEKNLLSILGESLKITHKCAKFPQIIFILDAAKVTVTIYDYAAYIQGNSSELFNKIFDISIGELNSDDDALISLNSFHYLDITSEELDRHYREQLPSASKKETNTKVIITLKNAVYNTMLTGFKPDYTDLISPISRIVEHYLHEMLTNGGVETQDVKFNSSGEISSVKNNFSYFNKDIDTGKFFICSHQVKSNLNEDQLELLERMYNWYNSNRHETSHWNKDSGDSTLIPTITEARDKILEGESLIEKFYAVY